MVFAGGVSFAVQVVATVVLARLLTPADFGIVSMVTTFSLLLSSFGLNGFTEAVIQVEELDHNTASNLFWINALAGLVLGTLFIPLGWLLARLYQNHLVANAALGLSLAILIGAV